jgi:photosystem II stability/assembly factor-like uncharacterized protein
MRSWRGCLGACLVLGLAGCGVNVVSRAGSATPSSPVPRTPRRTPASTPLAGHSLVAFHPLGISHGWAATASEVFWTQNGGVSWSTSGPSLPRGAQISTADFVDRQTGWVAAVINSQVLSVFRTASGGKSWLQTTLSFSGGAPDIKSTQFDFLTNSKGWLAVTPFGSVPLGVLFTTADGGSSWSPASSPLPGGGPVFFQTALNGWTVGGAAQNLLFFTQDAGKTWQKQPMPLPSGLTDCQPNFTQPATFFSSENGVLVAQLSSGISGQPTCRGILVYLTSDGGRTWTLGRTIIGSGPAIALTSQTVLALDEGGSSPEVRSGPVGAGTLEPQKALGLPRSPLIVNQLQSAGDKVVWAEVSYESGSELFASLDAGLTWNRLLIPR